jgi:hypothetical protein
MPAINRNENYRRLRRAGFTSYEANRFKDYSEQYIDKLLHLQKLYHEELKRLQLESGKVYHGKETSYT